MTHGTEYAYISGRCRCDICRTGYSDHQRRRRAKKRARGQCADCCQPTEPNRCYCADHLATRAAQDRQRRQNMTLPIRQCARCPAMIEPQKYSATLCGPCRTEAHRSRQSNREMARMHPDERPLIDETAAAIDAELARLDALRLRTRFRGTV